VSFFHWPIIRKYSCKGELINERIIDEIEDYLKPKYTLQDIIKNPEFHWDEIVNPVIISSASSKKSDGIFVKLNAPWILYLDDFLRLKKVYKESVSIINKIGLIWDFDLNKNEDKIYGVAPRGSKILCFSGKNQ
jgi:hypothetical protein